MLRGLFTKIVGGSDQREIARLQDMVEPVNALGSAFAALSDAQLQAKTEELRQRLAQGGTLDDVLVDAFAAVREVAKRTIGLRHYDVQLIGGIALRQGKIVEMKTGEGKTLVATLPLYLNALEGKGAHLVTVNDYLARRDLQWMGPVYDLLGLRAGLLQQGGESYVFDPDYTRGKYQCLRQTSRRAAYLADITYGTHNEFGFDYLRDNLAMSLDGRVQRDLHYALIDEVDNIFIDQARTPLIISGHLSQEEQKREAEEYRRFADIAGRLEEGLHYELDEREQNVTLTEAGLAKVEEETGITNIYDEANYHYVHFMEQALRAQVLFLKGRDYIVQSRRVILVDQFTGRLMPSRRLSEGLHQALEAKERVEIKPRTMTHATITIQNYFRMYDKLAGMTGTAATEAEEFYKIYHCDTLVLPTHVEYQALQGKLLTESSREGSVEVVTYRRPDDPEERYFRRIDFPDVVYGTQEAKWQAIIQEIGECYQARRPVLVGTTSVEKSETLGRELAARNIEHQVLYAKEHAREARIIARAGRPGVVTVATQMAGRGVDIKLGGELSDETVARARRLLESRGFDFFNVTQAQFYNAIAEIDPDYVRRREEVMKLGGLHIIGTERYEARRIDNQLRGRAGRQGEPGSSRFYLSLEDDLMRRFGGEQVKGLMDRLGLEDDVPIEHNLVSRTIESAQSRVEGYNFDIRKHLLEYDNVLTRQRELIYDQRYRILTSADISSDLWDMIEEEVDERLVGTSSETGDGWEIWSAMDHVLPLLLPRSDEPFPPPFSLANKWRCFPPFTIGFLAERLQGLSPEGWGDRILSLHRQAVDEYREYLLDSVVAEPLRRVEAEYQEKLERLTELLEQKISDYTELTEERGGTVRPRDLLQHLQRTFPLPLGVRQRELRGVEIDEVIDTLLVALERSYNQEVCDRLVRSIQARTPGTLKLEDVSLTDLDAGDVQALLVQARDNLHEGRSDTALDRIAQEVREGRLQRGRNNLLGLIGELNDLARLEISSLEPLFRQVVSLAYALWAERLEQEISRRVRASLGASLTTRGSVSQAVQFLLDVYYAQARSFDREHRKRVSFVSQFPLAFLVALSVRGMDEQELRQAILVHLKAALDEREQLWGEQELRRWEQQRLEDLSQEFHDDILEHLGESSVLPVQSIPAREWSRELRKALRCYLMIQMVKGKCLDDLDPRMGDAIKAHLKATLEERLGGQRILEMDVDTRDRVEEYLNSVGYFEDEDAKQRLFAQRVDHLDAQVFQGIARWLGDEKLRRVGGKPIGDLEPGIRRAVGEYLQRRGHFTDHKKVQHFLVYQRLKDLESETFHQVCSFLARRQIAQVADREVGRLGVGIRRIAMACLREARVLDDEERRREISVGQLSDLDEAVLVGFTREVGGHHFAAEQTLAELEGDRCQYVLDHLKREAYFRDEDAVASLPERRLADLGEEIEADIREHLRSEMLTDLEKKEVGELDRYLQEWVWAYLDEVDYLTDDSKVRQFRSEPLSRIRREFVPGLEEHLGLERLAALDGRPFLEMEQEVQENILQHLQFEGYFEDKAAEKRFVYNQTLADLDEEIYRGVARYLGRQRWQEIEGRWFGELPEEIQRSTWLYLKRVHYFVDEDLEELLPYVKIAAMEDEIHEGLISYLLQELDRELRVRAVGDLPASVQAGIRHFLEEMGYFVDQSGVDEFKQTPANRMDAEFYEATTRYLGQHLLAPYTDLPISDLNGDLRELLWDYLDRLDYFVDEEKEKEYARVRLGNLPAQVHEQIVFYLGRELEQEIGEQRVAELEDDLKQGLQQYFGLIDLEDEVKQELQEYQARRDSFVDEEKLRELDGQALLDWEEEKEGLGLLLGRHQLELVENQRLQDLPSEMQDVVRRYIWEENVCRDEAKYRAFQEHTLADLGKEMRDKVFHLLYQEWEQAIEGQCIGDLDERTQRSIWRFLEDWDFEFDEAQVRRLESQHVGEWEPQFYSGFVRYLGVRQMEDVGEMRIADLDEGTRRAVGAFFGQQLMHSVQRQVMLQSISRLWIDYLTDIEDLRRGIGLQSYAQRDPLVAYKRQAFEMFDALQDNIRRTVATTVFRLLPQPLR